MKGVVFGRGFLGNRIAKEFGYDLPDINVLNFEKLEKYLDEKKPDVVINTVGKTGRPNIDWCEENKEDTLLSNVAGAIMLSAACSKRKIYFVHIGSGCVYSGDNDGKGYSEEDEPNHVDNLYARTKVLSEKALKNLPGLLIRIRMPIDEIPNERNLIDKIKKYKKLIDIKNSMTSVPHMLIALKEMIDKRLQGVYNITNPKTISPVDIMRLYQEIVDKNHQFEVMSLEELDKVTKAKRSNCMLDTTKLKNVGIELPEAKEAVRQCLIKYKQNLAK